MINAMFALVFTVCAALAGCAGTSPYSKTADSGPLDKTDQFIQKGFAFRLGHSRARIIKNLGEPRAVRVELAKEPAPFGTNPSEEIKDEVIELFYDGLDVVLFRAAAENQELLQRVSITDPKYKLKWGLNIGSARNAVVDALGRPSETTHDSLVYRNSAGLDSSVTFYFKDDIVTKIDWWYSTE